MDLNMQGGSQIQVSDTVFGAEYKESLIHQVITSYMASARAGTKAQKNRAAVRGGGAKPWRQKGNGRARAGTIRSPIFRTGGVTFAAQPTDHGQKINRKMYQGALRSLLSELIRQDRLLVVEDFVLDGPKTKDLVAKLSAMDLKDVMIVVVDPDTNMLLAQRNLYHVDIRDSRDIDPVSMLGYKKVLMTSAALKQIEERLS